MGNEQKKIKAKGVVGVYFRASETKRFGGKPDKCYYIVYRDSGKKLVWEKIGWVSEGYSAALASSLRSQRIVDVRHGEEIPREKAKAVTFGEVWERYDEWQETNILHPLPNRYRYNLHLKKLEGKRLEDISPMELEGIKSELLKAGKSPATAKHTMVLVRQIFNKAKAWGLYQGDNPVRSVKLPKLNNRRERFLSYDEAHILLEELEQASVQLRDMALLSLHTGMRAGEIFNLKWGHLDFELGLIHIADPKSGRSRKAFLTDTLREVLKDGNRNPEELVFINRDGNPIQRASNTFNRVLEKLGWNKGITDARQKVTFHTLRHTFASWLAINGTHILTIKELMGHQTLAMTERYSHLIPDVKQDAMRELEAAFRADPKSGQSASGKKLQAS